MVRKLIILLTIILIGCSAPKKCCSQTKQVDIKKLLKFSTFYAAVNGGTSLSDVDVFSVDNGLSTQTISTPYDYNFTIGLRKIARFGYENKAQTFYDGTESNYSDAATVGKVKGVEYLFLNIAGREIKPIATTVAPTIPVVAASKAPTKTTDIPKPPLTGPNN